jgi:hypothetical protein
MPRRKAEPKKPSRPKTRAPAREGESNAGRKRAPHHVAFGVVVTGKILDAMRRGATQSMAAALAGVAPRTIRRWLDQGRRNCDDLDRFGVGNWPAGKPAPELDAYGEFALAYAIAEGDPLLACVDTIMAAIRNGDVPAAFKFLGVRKPNEWSTVVNLRQVDVDSDGAVTTAESDASVILAKLAAQAQAIEAIKQGGARG